MVAPLQAIADGLRCLYSFHLLRSSILLHWDLASRLSTHTDRLAPRCRDWLLCPRFLKRGAVLRRQLCRRG